MKQSKANTKKNAKRLSDCCSFRLGNTIFHICCKDVEN